jgi:hypothetical protein
MHSRGGSDELRFNCAIAYSTFSDRAGHHQSPGLHGHAVVAELEPNDEVTACRARQSDHL